MAKIPKEDPDMLTPETVPNLLLDAVEAIGGVRELGKIFEQSRASRADKTLDKIVQDLLTLAGIPSEAVTRGDKKYNLDRISLVMPDRQTAVDNPKAHFLSLKTSLSGHWKQAVEERQLGQKTHMITVLQGKTLGNNVAWGIVKHGIFLYLLDMVETASRTSRGSESCWICPSPWTNTLTRAERRLDSLE